MTNKKKPDWELAERLFRAGQLSNVQIATQIGITEGALRKRAKRDGWQKDLADRVRKATDAKLVRTQVRISNAEDAARTEREIVEQAAENAVAVVRAHRRDLTQGQHTIAVLFNDLKVAAVHRAELEEEAIEQAGEGLGAGQRRAAFMRALSLPTHAGVIRDLSNAMKNFQALERQAWNLNDKDAGTTAEYEKRLKALGQEPGDE